jgi:hypothetical protein
METIRKFRCRSCGLEIVANDETLTIAHEAPECSRFTELVREHGGSDGKLVHLDESGRVVGEYEK